MPVAELDFEQVLGTVDQLSSDELDLLQKRIAQSRQKKVSPTSRGYPEEAQELFAIPFAAYMAMSDDEREAVAFRAYMILDRWIEQELKARRAKWMLVSGGEILESSSKFNEYPSRAKLMQLGKERGRIPFVFIATPLIEESNWSALADSDYYPTLTLTAARFGANENMLTSDGVVIEADFDTGSFDLLLDYDQMISNDVIDRMPMQVVLDGETKTTEILAKKPAAKKPRKRK